MGRIYTVVLASQTIAAASGDYDWINIAPAAEKPILLRGWILSQTSEEGDAQEEGLRFRVHNFFTGSGSYVAGSGGTTPTPKPRDRNDAAAGFTVRCADSTVATLSGGTSSDDILDEFGWNERLTPYDFWYPGREYAPKAHNGEHLILRMETTPGDDFTGMATFFIEEE